MISLLIVPPYCDSLDRDTKAHENQPPRRDHVLASSSRFANQTAKQDNGNSNRDEERYLLRILIPLFLLSVIPLLVVSAILWLNPDAFMYQFGPESHPDLGK
ncbi:hypothetical protein Pla22_50300 [Rubripirellula amarantea]|uniref:Uncharacterized protein n=1 Tax=Rubripirellula amarantea TaxID=2527999 RepID=A0A5C5WBK5_9BACT|nr:hypothetical protein [Rubripirellula amarantea]TWT48030.1 hypothetical protein Pla22_50300 [Rubripirellula amarantea]